MLPLFTSCVAKSLQPSALPPETVFNKGAGSGDLILLTLRTEWGEELLFALETGGAIVDLDRSLEPKLGTALKGTKVYSTYGTGPARLYAAPKLFLGNTQLEIGDKVLTVDLSRLSNDLNRMSASRGRLMGLLGMSCLQNYCIRLDFAENKMQFLDPESAYRDSPGKAFPLTISDRGVFVRDNLAGMKGASSQIDTGCNFDGVLTPKLFQLWTNTAPDAGPVQVHSPNGLFGGNSYTNLVLHGDGDENLLGLGFLARHIVTFNFPKRTMHLKQTSIGRSRGQEEAAAGAR